MSDENVDLQSWGWTDLSSYSLSEFDSEKEPQLISLGTNIMSRRSLRLDDGLLDRSLPHSSASFSTGGGGIWRNTRSVKSRHSQHHSVSCSESLLVHTPRKRSGQLIHNSSIHSVASDASLLSSLLDESSIQESTLVNTLWGLDHDPKESTVIAEQSTIVADSTLTGSEGRCPKHPAQTLGRIYCKDCELATHCSSVMQPGPLENEELETCTIYSRDRNRKSQTGVWSSGVTASRRAAARVCSLLCRLLLLLLHTLRDVSDRSSRSGVMSLKGSSTDAKELHPNGSLCKTVCEAFRCLSKQGRPTTSHLLSRFPLRLFVVLLPLLVLLLSLCLFGPAGLQSVLQVVSSSFTSSESHSAETSVELNSPPLPAEARMVEEEKSTAIDESARLGHLEQSLAVLWEHVEAGGQRAEQRHQELLQLHSSLLQQQLEPWTSTQLGRQLDKLRTRLDEEGELREQARLQDLVQQQSQTSRLDQLELQLQELTAKTEKMQWRSETPATVSPSSTAVSVGVDRQSHEALLAEVARLDKALEDLRQDMKSLFGVQNGRQQLDRIQQVISVQVSSRVREELRALVYGNEVAVGCEVSRDEAGLPKLLLPWLSQHYVSGADLQAALASLELSILQNISLQLEQRHTEETVRHSVLDATAAAGASVTLEDVHVIVRNALRLFSHDRTGLADYALESGGGSILSTRCSETYETKAALLSLFGVPLWYFSQSPRTVIQPEAHPGNCWAFRGSVGFLVIRLSMRIIPTAVSLEHIPKALTPSGTLLSAPRDFSVYGLDDESQERGKLLGTYTYDEDGEALQTYTVTEENDRAFQIIEVRVLSNWGHEEYTCMYRFRVHGRPSDA